MTPGSLPTVSGPPAVDALAVRCPYCRAPEGQGCTTSWFRPCRPHKARTELARILAADSDPVLDEWFPKRGQCQLCGTPGLDQRHRVVDAIADRVLAGDDEDEVATDYGVPVAAVLAVVEWARKWQPEKGQQR